MILTDPSSTQERKRSGPATLGLALIRDSQCQDGFGKLSRHEAAANECSYENSSTAMSYKASGQREGDPVIDAVAIPYNGREADLR
jgi:hypothetical protein